MLNLIFKKKNITSDGKREKERKRKTRGKGREKRAAVTIKINQRIINTMQIFLIE